MEQCNIQGCTFRCRGHTDNLWRIRPENTTERPVCPYHHYQREYFHFILIPFLGLMHLSIPFLVDTFSVQFLDPSAGLIHIILTFVVLFSGLLIGAIGSTLLLLAFEFLAVRFMIQGLPALRKKRDLVEEKSEISECISCGKSNCDGFLRQYRSGTQLFGEYISADEKGINEYCKKCAESSPMVSELRMNEDVVLDS